MWNLFTFCNYFEVGIEENMCWYGIRVIRIKGNYAENNFS